MSVVFGTTKRKQQSSYPKKIYAGCRRSSHKLQRRAHLLHSQTCVLACDTFYNYLVYRMMLYKVLWRNWEDDYICACFAHYVYVLLRLNCNRSRCEGEYAILEVCARNVYVRRRQRRIRGLIVVCVSRRQKCLRSACAHRRLGRSATSICLTTHVVHIAHQTRQEAAWT